MKKALTTLLFLLSTAAAPARADETAAQLPQLPAEQATTVELAPPASFMSRAVDQVGSTIERALDFLGIRYKRGGGSPETGFDCSGFVRYVYGETLGLILPHSARAIAQTGEKVDKSELRPGDLVFFNTMRRAFSHVGIYLGDNLFVHAPRSGARVRIEDMSDRYWSRRYNGARRIRP
ncbi:MAG: C40 family peptidase [Pseudomonadota bacterium]